MSPKEVKFDENLKNEVHLDNIDVVERSKELIDSLGFAKRPLERTNIEDLNRAVPGVQEFYVATSSGGSPTTKLTFTNGILTSVT